MLSPEDTWAKIRERLDEYVAMGVEHVWCFEPEAREVRRYTASGFDKVTAAELVVEGTAIRVGIAEVFSVLDEDGGEWFLHRELSGALDLVSTPRICRKTLPTLDPSYSIGNG